MLLKKKYLFRLKCFILFLVSSLHLNAEEWPTYSIVQLSVFANQVVEGHFLQQIDDQYFFLVRSIHDQQGVTDTLVLEGLSSWYNHIDYLKKATSLLLYLNQDENGKSEVCFSGMRLWLDEKIFYPFQAENPGIFSFFAGRDSMTWESLQNNARNADIRIQKVKALKQETDLDKRNLLLFDFLEKNIESFGKGCGLNGNCGWGALEYELFEWICEAASAEDTWRASQLYRSFPISWDKESQRSLHSHEYNAFKTQAEVDFLMTKTTEQTSSLAERKQALVFLRKACHIVYQVAHRGFEKLPLTQQKLLQKQYRSQLFPLLNDLELRQHALTILFTLSNPMDHSIRHRIDLSDLDQFIEHYQNLQEVSAFRGDLAEFIAYNAEEATWKKISGNDKSILIDLYHIYMDTIKQELHFFVRRRNRRAIIYTMPQLLFYPVNAPTNTAPLSFPTPSNFPLPYNNRSGYSLRFDLSSIPKGKWQFFLKGTAGENNEYQWTSLKGLFEKK